MDPALTLFIPILQGVLRVKSKRCDDAPFKLVCTVATPIYRPPIHKLWPVLKRERKFMDVWHEDRMITNDAVSALFKTHGVDGVLTSVLKKL